MQNISNVLSNEAHTAQKQSRGGWTMVEVLVTTAIIGVLAALGLPAIQQARDAARRTQEANDLKQVGVALHAHASTFDGKLPAGMGRDANSGQLVPWTVEILPYIDQAPLYNMWDRTKGPNQQDETVLQAKVPPYGRYDEGGDFSSGLPAGKRQPNSLQMVGIAGDLVFNNNIPPTWDQAINTQGSFFPRNGDRTGFNGMLPPYQQVRLEDAKGGTSNVIMVAQHTASNARDNRPSYNPFNDVDPVTGAQKNQRHLFKSIFEIVEPQVYQPVPNQPSIPVDLSSEAGYLQQWGSLTVGVGPYEKNVDVSAMAARPHSHLREVTGVLYADGHVKFVRQYDGGARPTDQDGLRVLRNAANRNVGEPSLNVD